MQSRLLARLALLSVGACPVIACTDNGPGVYGPSFGSFPEREGGTEPLDDGGGRPDQGDAADGASPACASGRVAVLAGGAASFAAAMQDKDGAWESSALGGSIGSKPALVAFGAGFLGVAQSAADTLVGVEWTGAWSGVATLGTSGVKGPPSLAVAGTSAHLVYSAGAGLDRFFWSGIHDGNAWNAAVTAVGSPQSFGTISAGLAPVGTDVVFAENGTDGKLYVRSSAGGWGASKEVAGAATGGGGAESAPPELVALDGAFDLVAIYVDGPTRQIASATRAASGNPNGDWIDRDSVDVLARTNEKLSVARIAPDKLLVAFRGQDGNGYSTVGTIAGGSITWVSAQPLGGAVASAPALAKGICGDDAVAVFAQADAIKVARLRGTTWSTPETIPNATGSYVAVATLP